ncbi:MAG: GNAT family N-acetyltransferase [Idiomarina sp.]|nr:GNAT family N-acetyltransferase [Idiomarina sp.]
MKVSASNLQIRLATPADAPALAELERATYAQDSYPSFFFAQAVQQWDQAIWIAEADQALLGYLLFAPAASHDAVWLMSLLTSHAARGQGIARLLLEQSLLSLRSRQIKVCWLSVAPDNEAAKNLYLNLGFKLEQDAPDYLGPGERRWIMKKVIDHS